MQFHNNYNFYYEIIIISYSFTVNLFIGSGITKDTVLSVTPQSAPGSLLGNVDIYINEALITNTSSLTVEQFFVEIQHNYGDELIRRYHGIRPTFRLTANNTFSSLMNYYSITLNATSLAKLRDTPLIQCFHGYHVLKLNIVLTSDSLYHLGDHEMEIYGFHNLDIDDYYPNFGKHYKVRVQAGMFSTIIIIIIYITICTIITLSECDDPSLLYDFATHECVSQCSCGYAPFRRHSTAYCEASK